MKLHRFEDASQFYERVKDYLLSQEALHSLLLGICNTLIHYPQQYDCQPYLASVEMDGKIVAVAMRTPPRRLILSKIEKFAAVEAFAERLCKSIAQDLHSDQQQLPGVSGLAAEAFAFAQAWQAITSQSYKLEKQLRIHQLDKVQPISNSSGYLRQAIEDESLFLQDWYKAFAIEAFGSVEGNEERTIKHYLSQKSLYVWQDQVPVSMARSRLFTPSSALIGPVYTPPEYRRKGYATSCVAALSQTLLDQGCRYCFLFTDLANPTSNHIYQAIGYQPVGDWNDYSFSKNIAIDITA
ncbi:GNAT family N-acetyltransferase [Scytonema sp. PCC 10023]|uniref:GNAT family N-acetyltransferase n=1 Tax=Scytonema sp. PCC 10023 TaxID=1680591 RepID=UPI0039C729B3